ncbi:GLIPR1-like protein 1 [Strongylocentrotus purpuratus]|uniref:SCP domain-containing protein n=1 Tax=Strongylocentrotus purpuratus TaxID=7668 RepID=A0A7M7NYJ4_STRPU|nr:GLIPR1-like protein 1 [Strongylocentrotus purpuratus]
MRLADTNFTVFVDSWNNMADYYNFENNNCTRDFCYPYTQIVWAATSLVGCGMTECEEMGDTEFVGKLFVCMYGPRSNHYVYTHMGLNKALGQDLPTVLICGAEGHNK